jgi:pimeloyl-ACP methyl ester carboxylesterase
MPYVATQDGTFYYDVADYSDPWLEEKDTLVMHHGFCRNGDVWYGWVPHLARYFRVLRIDARGCGRSSKPDRGFEPSLEGFTADLGNILDSLAIKRIHFIGESFGGIVGLNFSKRFPEQVQSLILCNTPCRLPDTLLETYALEFGSGAAAIETLGVREWCMRTLAYRLDTELAPSGLQHWYAREMGRTPSWFAAKWLSFLPGLDFTPFLPEIKRPVLLLAGNKSAISTQEQQDTMHRAIPECELSLLNGVGHGVNVIAPKRCARATLRFLEAHFETQAATFPADML